MLSGPGSKEVFLVCPPAEARFEVERRPRSDRDGALVATPGVRINERRRTGAYSEMSELARDSRGLLGSGVGWEFFQVFSNMAYLES